MFEADRDQFQKWMKNVVVACIGPITAKTVEGKGFSASLMPSEYTIEALTNAIVNYYLPAMKK